MKSNQKVRGQDLEASIFPCVAEPSPELKDLSVDWIQTLKFFGAKLTWVSDSQYKVQCPNCAGEANVNLHATGGAKFSCKCRANKCTGNEILDLLFLITKLPRYEIVEMIRTNKFLQIRIPQDKKQLIKQSAVSNGR